MDRASWPALILFVPLTCPPEPCSPPVHPRLQAGERNRVCKLLSPEHPWLVLSLESPPLSPWPHSQERGLATESPGAHLRPARAAHPRSPEPVPPPLLSQRTGPGSTRKRGRRAVPTAPHCPGPPVSVSGQPFCCSPGTSHTLAQEAPRLPSKRSPFSARPQGRQVGGSGPGRPAGF